jgi:DNA-binding Lrp family transcriptional regulator
LELITLPAFVMPPVNRLVVNGNLQKMDKIDQKILTELDIEPTIACSTLAKKIKISQQRVDYRIRKLKENGIIQKFGTIINMKYLGLEHYRIFFRFNSLKEHSNSEIFNYLKNRTNIYWSARIGGKYDLLVVIFVKDIHFIDEFITEFCQRFPNLIKDFISCYGLNYRIYTHKYLSKNNNFIEYGYDNKKEPIDELDLNILKKIKDDCRLSALEISKDLGVTYKTIINRKQTLEKKGIIVGKRLFIKSTINKPYILLIAFHNYSKEKENALLAFLAINISVTQTIRLFGAWDLFIHSRFESTEEFQNYIIELRNKFDIIADFQSIPIFEDISINLMPM